jgi:hypothetical protein
LKDLVVIILLGIVAGFLPLQFGAEISLLGGEKGVRKASGLAIGYTLFRFLLAVLIVVLSAGSMVALSGARGNIRSFLASILKHLGQTVTSGEHAVIDGLLVIAGAYLLYLGYGRLRGGAGADQMSEEDDKQRQRRGAIAMILLGFAWAAGGANQWLFTAAGMGQIMGLEANLAGRASAYALFLVLSSLMLMTPILFAVIRPDSAAGTLEKINETMTGVLGYVMTIGFFLIGAFLIWQGGIGLYRHLSG